MMQHTLPDVVALLSMESLPTVDQLTALPWQATEDAWVYANLMILQSSANKSPLRWKRHIDPSQGHWPEWATCRT